MTDIIFSDYLSRPQMDVATSIALSLSLASASSPAFGDRCAACLDAMNACRVSLEAGWRAQLTHGTENSRPAQRECALAWVCVVERVRLATTLAPPRYAPHAAATALYAILAPDGLEVVKLPFHAQWTTLDTRLRIVREQMLPGDLRAVAGEAVVDELLRAHGEFGRVLGITASREAGTEVNLLDLLRALTHATTDYVLQVLAYAQRDRPETVRAVQLALKPIDDARAAVRRAAAATDDAKPAAKPAEAPKPAPAADAKPVTKPSIAPRPSVAPPN